MEKSSLEPSLYGQARTATPIFNTPFLHKIFQGTSLPVDNQGLLRAVECVALKGASFTLQPCGGEENIYQVTTSAYPASFKSPTYVDKRFLDCSSFPFPEKKREVFSPERILGALRSLEGTRYIWGGNWHGGVPELLEWYPPEGKLDKDTQEIWTLKGVDCSGLLYEVTEGFTPRNTSELLQFGEGVAIEGKKPEEIASLLQPLDLLVWKGHVVIVLDSKTAIESRAPQGVLFSSLLSRLEEICQERLASNEPRSSAYFLVRRWHPAFL